MPEIRQNLITREWVIIATERAKRPEEFIQKNKEKKEIPSYVPTCPFCPGNEDKTPSELFRIGGSGKNWKIRVVPNKFAALSREGDCKRIMEGIKRSINGKGIHEVLVETPLHNMTTALLPVEQIRSIVEMYKNRFLAAYQDECVEHVVVFKNHGEGAGTSLEHPHSQLIATPVVPSQVRERMEEAIRYFDDTGECVFCRTLKEELGDGDRIVWEGRSFVAFIPYAALSAFHTWIFPKRHNASFGSITPEEMDDLAITLKTVMAKFYYGLDNPDFNYVIRSLSLEENDEECCHWYITIVPRVSKAAGFELGSGMFINTALPEVSAKFLRETKLPF